MAIKVIAQQCEEKLGKNLGKKFVISDGCSFGGQNCGRFVQ